ncbi:serine/arginine-rich splicing factor SR30-like isoform X2 [Alnus glutinosa]|uniref:serine/arginine-rich splicing factor SR30-like isoform X2 n=1 Tax=Alnus glutinosa TaxID=3517 RepID=UPI002D78FE69|nr:serine/arginine-rich splicing factor SR30-like isoform X2 [Alnus glutinosa]XP_062147249.1 serine/arginine-rich splicing factor SR30-like isoform X2 [Alnus glutinosa]
MPGIVDYAHCDDMKYAVSEYDSRWSYSTSRSRDSRRSYSRSPVRSPYLSRSPSHSHSYSGRSRSISPKRKYSFRSPSVSHSRLFVDFLQISIQIQISSYFRIAIEHNFFEYYFVRCSWWTPNYILLRSMAMYTFLIWIFVERSCSDLSGLNK